MSKSKPSPPSNIPKWDPATLLQIHNPSAQGWSCKGTTQLNRRCLHPLSQSKRDAILLLLPKLSPLPPSNPSLDEEYLSALSHCVFCYDHDDDDAAEEVMERWEGDLMRARSAAGRFTFTAAGGGGGATKPVGRHILTPRGVLGNNNNNNPSVKSEQQQPKEPNTQQTPPGPPKESPSPKPPRDTGIPDKPEPPSSSPQPTRIKREREEETSPHGNDDDEEGGSSTEEEHDHHDHDNDNDKKEDLGEKTSVLKDLRDEEEKLKRLFVQHVELVQKLERMGI